MTTIWHKCWSLGGNLWNQHCSDASWSKAMMFIIGEVVECYGLGGCLDFIIAAEFDQLKVVLPALHSSRSSLNRIIIVCLLTSAHTVPTFWKRTVDFPPVLYNIAPLIHRNYSSRSWSHHSRRRYCWECLFLIRMIQSRTERKVHT